MAFIATAVVGDVIGGLFSSNSQKKAAQAGADAQVRAAQLGVDEQQRQFDAIQELLRPYNQAGTQALGMQQGLLGLNGNTEQSNLINQLMGSGQYQELNRQGQNAILQNASATGGLRGGNVQAALAQFSPQLLQQMIQSQFSNLGGLTTTGQNSAAMVGTAGQQMAMNNANLYAQQGAAQAGAALAGGRADAQMYGGIASGLGKLGGIYNNNQAPIQFTQQAPAYSSMGFGGDAGFFGGGF